MSLFATPPDPRIARPTAPHRATLAQRLAGAITGPDRRVRDLLETWFARLPVPAQTDVRSRLWERDRRLALAAFWELYLHELLTRLGYQLVPHPTVPGAGARPDFLATRDQEAFYLEALIHGPSTEAWRAERRLYPILDVLHEVQREPFVVTLAQATCGHGTPPLRALRSELVRWLDSLSPATTDATLSWQRGSWSLQFRARRASSIRADEPTAPSSPSLSLRTLLSKVQAKARRYRVFDRPLLLALATSQAWPESTSRELAHRLVEQLPDPAAGILLAAGLDPWTIASTPLLLAWRADAVAPLRPFLAALEEAGARRLTANILQLDAPWRLFALWPTWPRDPRGGNE
ncbi:hypothetical protein [Thermomicrobium sp.]